MHCVAQLLFTGERLNIGSSRGTWDRVAPSIGLNPQRRLEQVPAFALSRAKLPKTYFDKILNSILCEINCYGPVKDHRNEEIHSRTISPVGVCRPK